MTSPLIAEYVTGLHQSLPADIADEAATGLIDTYQDHLDSGVSDQVAAHAALAEFGDLTMVVGEFTRQAPGRHAARLLLASGPVVGACWAAALVLSRAWTWPLPTAARLSFGAVLLLAVLALALAASSQHSYHRTRLTAAASPILLALDTTAVAAVLLDAPALTWALGTAVAASLTRIAFTAWALPRIATY
jgi:hypothetical protein